MAELTYSYDPSKIGEFGVDQMRFELGDSFTDGGKKTCALCDEEYHAIISKNPDNWKAAKYECVSAIVNKLGFQIDYSVSSMSLSLSQRFKQWQELKKEMEKSMSIGVPSASFSDSSADTVDDSHYFNFGMHDILPGTEGD